MMRVASDEKQSLWQLGGGSFASHLPEDIVDGVAQESFSVVGRQQFGTEYCHELLKVHLAIPCRQTHTHKGTETDCDDTKSDTQTGRLAVHS